MPSQILAETKCCAKCKETYPKTTEYFYPVSKRGTRKDRLTSYCKECTRANVRDKEASRLNGRYCLMCEMPLKASKTKYCNQECLTLYTVGGIGAKHGQLTVISYVIKNRKSAFLCRCDCGTERTVKASYLANKTIRCCGNRRCKKVWNLKEGPLLTSKGYVRIYAPEHPNAIKNDGRIWEHVYVMSQFLGRPLRRDEQIHHRNGNKRDNSLFNLELWTHSQPSGQRVEDMVAFCESYLRQYKADARKLAQLHAPADPRQLVLVD